jgi:hypothetical protein
MGMGKTMSPIVMINHVLTFKTYKIIVPKYDFASNLLPTATYYAKTL